MDFFQNQNDMLFLTNTNVKENHKDGLHFSGWEFRRLVSIIARIPTPRHPTKIHKDRCRQHHRRLNTDVTSSHKSVSWPLRRFSVSCHKGENTRRIQCKRVLDAELSALTTKPTRPSRTGTSEGLGLPEGTAAPPLGVKPHPRGHRASFPSGMPLPPSPRHLAHTPRRQASCPRAPHPLSRDTSPTPPWGTSPTLPGRLAHSLGTPLPLSLGHLAHSPPRDALSHSPGAPRSLSRDVSPTPPGHLAHSPGTSHPLPPGAPRPLPRGRLPHSPGAPRPLPRGAAANETSPTHPSAYSPGAAAARDI